MAVVVDNYTREYDRIEFQRQLNAVVLTANKWGYLPRFNADCTEVELLCRGNVKHAFGSLAEAYKFVSRL